MDGSNQPLTVNSDVVVEVVPGTDNSVVLVFLPANYGI